MLHLPPHLDLLRRGRQATFPSVGSSARPPVLKATPASAVWAEWRCPGSRDSEKDGEEGQNKTGCFGLKTTTFGMRAKANPENLFLESFS
jgi:hypothetical protein